MVNDEVLIKISRSFGYKDWPHQVNIMKDRLSDLKLGFPGVRNEHMTIFPFKDIVDGDIFIYDPGFFTGAIDEAPVMLKVNGKSATIEGIGKGWDFFDPDRILRRWNDVIDIPPINQEWPVYRIDIKPDLNGGPGYYYFLKSYRDFRY